jgi:hypothetical protein
MLTDEALVAELVRAHAAHTVILYGSRARGDATAESDVDVACWADGVESSRDARIWAGLYLDGFVHPTAHAEAPVSEDQLKLLGGRVLLDTRGLGAALLARVEALDAAGPPELPESERRMRRVWAHKMLARIRRGDLEAQYRHHWLLFQLLEDDFALRGQWYRGPKRALAILAQQRPRTHAAFVAALAPGASLAALEALVACVAGVTPE